MSNPSFDPLFLARLLQAEQALHEPLGEVAARSLTESGRGDWVDAQYTDGDIKPTPHASNSSEKHTALFLRTKEAMGIH